MRVLEQQAKSLPKANQTSNMGRTADNSNGHNNTNGHNNSNGRNNSIADSHTSSTCSNNSVNRGCPATGVGSDKDGSQCSIICDMAMMVDLESREQPASPGDQDARGTPRDDESVWGPIFKSRENFVEMHLC